jgi:succinyl-diaminopimelate desuccinylase
MSISVIKLTQDLIRCASITPVDAGAQDLLAKVLKDSGFECFHLPFGDVPNLFARIGNGGPHICYAGHTDVVPPGPDHEWTHGGPFSGEIVDGRLYGRGAADMKGSVAAFAAAAIAHVETHGAPKKGSISLLITGDEEAEATHGTVKVLEWMEEHGHLPDVALVGEPSNPAHLGQEIKVGRRGSLSGEITVKGKQGHVAYQKLADNPLPRMIKLLDALAGYSFDTGTEFFAPTNLEVTTVDTGNKADNVIPGAVFARFNVRFNDTWDAESLGQKIKEILDGVTKNYELKMRSSSPCFLTKPGPWLDTVKRAVEEITGETPALTTSGGTSDARFIQKYCPVVEFGPVNATIHQINENAEVTVLEDLEKVYARVLELYLS